MLGEAATRSLINRKRKRQATLYGHVMRREKLGHLVTTGMIEGKCSSEKLLEKMLDGLIKRPKSRTSDRCTESNEG